MDEYSLTETFVDQASSTETHHIVAPRGGDRPSVLPASLLAMDAVLPSSEYRTAIDNHCRWMSQSILKHATELAKTRVLSPDTIRNGRLSRATVDGHNLWADARAAFMRAADITDAWTGRFLREQNRLLARALVHEAIQSPDRPPIEKLRTIHEIYDRLNSSIDLTMPNSSRLPRRREGWDLLTGAEPVINMTADERQHHRISQTCLDALAIDAFRAMKLNTRSPTQVVGEPDVDLNDIFGEEIPSAQYTLSR